MKFKSTIAILVSFTCGLASMARADFLTLSPDGVRIDSGTMGSFTLEYPALVNAQGATDKITDKNITGVTGKITYESGASVTVTINGNDVAYAYANVPGGVKETRYSMSIPFSLQQGGKFKMGDKEEAPFPVDQVPGKPHFFQGHSPSLSIINFDNTAFTIAVPDSFDYLELTDLREWSNSSYSFLAHVPFIAEHPTYEFVISPGTKAAAAPTASGSGAAARPTLVDEFGQIKFSDWPDKVKSEADLAADVKSEADYYASLNPPAFDKYGGLPGSGPKLGLKTTGYFHVEKKGDKWMLVDPDGNLFFHLGLCSFQPGDDFTKVAGRKQAFDWLPPVEGDFKTAYKSDQGDGVFSFHTANMIRKYAKPITFPDFQSIMIDRVRKWGFNSVGAFSGVAQDVVQAKCFPYVSSLPLDQWGGHIRYIPGISGAWDPFDAANVKQVDVNFAKELPKRANDALLIGYFLTNEPLYEDIPKHVPTLKGSKWACKHELVQELTAKYQTIDAFNQAWGMKAASFDELEDESLDVKTKPAFEDVNAFTGKFLETYFKLVADTFHKYDSTHMLIGNRFQSGTINNEQLCTIAGKYLDVMSFNYYTYALDKDFLARVYRWTGRPMFLSEFNYGSAKESGLTGGLDNGTQQGRGLGYRNYIEQATTLPFIVGAEWFTLIDEASTGRWYEGYTGERGNSGLISVTDRPYKPMLAEMMKTNYAIYDLVEGLKPAFAYDDPRFSMASGAKQNAEAPHARGPIAIDGATQNWPGTPAVTVSGKHVVQGTDSGGTEGAFKLCWDEKNLYLLLNVVDPTPMMNKHAGHPEDVWNGDAAEIFLGTEKIEEGGTLLFSDRHLMIGAAGPGKAPFFYGNSPEQYGCETIIVPGGDGKGYTLEAAIPWDALGVTPTAGLKLLFDIGIDDSANGEYRQHQIMWNGTQENSRDRTHWGTATLLQ